MNENEVLEAQMNDFDMKPNPNGSGIVLSPYDVVTDKLLSVQTASIIGIIFFSLRSFQRLCRRANHPMIPQAL